MKKLIGIIFVSIYSFGNIGTVMTLKGEAKIKRSINIKAKMGMKLLEGDVILTSSLSKMQVILIDDTVITIGANSSFGFKEFKFDGTKKSKVTLQANSGYFRTITGRSGKIAPDRFRVKTLNATIGVRGTDFGGYITKDKEIIKCYSGSIWVKLDSGGVKNVLSNMLIEISNNKATQTSYFKIDKPRIEKLPEPINSPIQNVMPNSINDVSITNVKPKCL